MSLRLSSISKPLRRLLDYMGSQVPEGRQLSFRWYAIFLLVLHTTSDNFISIMCLFRKDKPTKSSDTSGGCTILFYQLFQMYPSCSVSITIMYSKGT